MPASLIMGPELPGGVAKRPRELLLCVHFIFRDAYNPEEFCIEGAPPNIILDSEKSDSFWQGWS